MKFLKLFFIPFMLSVTSFTQAASTAGCPLPSDEKLVCAVVMCDFGLVFGEWSPECTQYKKDFAVYLATLGFWDKPPKCKLRDEKCAKVGNASKPKADASTCSGFSGNKSHCMRGVAINNSSCDELSGAQQRTCYIELARETNSCESLATNEAFECLDLANNSSVLDASVYGEVYGRIGIRFGGDIVAVVDAMPTYWEFVRVNDARQDSLGRSLVLAGMINQSDCPRVGGLLKDHCSEGWPLVCWGTQGNYRDADSELGKCLAEHNRIK